MVDIGEEMNTEKEVYPDTWLRKDKRPIDNFKVVDASDEDNDYEPVNRDEYIRKLMKERINED